MDVVVDVVGGEPFQEFFEALQPGGSVVTAGAVAGPVIDIDPRTVYLNHPEIVGLTMGLEANSSAWSVHRKRGTRTGAGCDISSLRFVRPNVSFPGTTTWGVLSSSRNLRSLAVFLDRIVCIPCV